MKEDQLEKTIHALLTEVGASFLLDRQIGTRSIRDRLEEIIRKAAATELVEFGVPGETTELRRNAEGVMNFFYRPHLFPGMDPKLLLGHLVQYDLLPRELPVNSPVEAVAMLESYCHLSGDLFGWVATGDDELTMWVLDVSGHGVTAGFAAVVIKMILGDIDPGVPLTLLAKEVESGFLEMRNPDDPSFIYSTGVFLRIARTGTVEYLSAGHPPVFVKRHNGPVEQYESTAVPLCLFPEMETASSSFEIGSNDSLMVCTDGLLELQNEEGEFFDTEHTVESLNASDGSPFGIYSSLTRAIADFHELERLEDDLSFVALRLRASNDP